MSERDAIALVSSVKVFARASPLHKVRAVDVLLC
jgi:magnesium-transporting ATPase (P-type)